MPAIDFLPLKRFAAYNLPECHCQRLIMLQPDRIPSQDLPALAKTILDAFDDEGGG